MGAPKTYGTIPGWVVEKALREAERLTQDKEEQIRLVCKWLLIDPPREGVDGEEVG
jgi:hypothetical protein